MCSSISLCYDFSYTLFALRDRKMYFLSLRYTHIHTYTHTHIRTYVHAHEIPLLLSLRSQTIVVFSFPFGYSKCSGWKIKFARQAATAKYRIPPPIVNRKVCLSRNVRGDDGDSGVNGGNLFHERVQLSERFNLGAPGVSRSMGGNSVARAEIDANKSIGGPPNEIKQTRVQRRFNDSTSATSNATPCLVSFGVGWSTGWKMKNTGRCRLTLVFFSPSVSQVLLLPFFPPLLLSARSFYSLDTL